MDIKRLESELGKIEDPQRTKCRHILHKLEDIILIGLCTLICDGSDFVDMEEFGKAREDWLRKFLELPNGIPDSDTFRRVFERLEPKTLSECLYNWLSCNRSEGSVIAVELRESAKNTRIMCLDVIFDEDGSRARKDNSPLNLNVLRKAALVLCKATDMGIRVSIQKKRFRATLGPHCFPLYPFGMISNAVALRSFKFPLYNRPHWCYNRSEINKVPTAAASAATWNGVRFPASRSL